MPAVPRYVVVWGLLVLAWIANYLVRMAVPALLPAIMTELDLSYTSAGILATSAFFYAYAVAQLPAGLLGDRFGQRRVLVAGLVGGALASALTGLAGSFAALLAARMLTGASQGMLFSNDRVIIAAVTPEHRIAFGQAVSFSGPGLGITLGLLLSGALGDQVGWRPVFIAWAVPPILSALLIVWFVPVTEATLSQQPRRALRSVAARPALWLLGLTGTAVMWIQYVLATWSTLLFVEAGVREVSRAAAYASLQGIAAVVGLLVGGWAGDRASRAGLSHRVVVVASLIGVTASMTALAVTVQRVRSPAHLIVAVVAVALCASAVWGPSFALLGELMADSDRSTAFGLYNTVCVLGAMLGPVVTGWVRDQTGSFVIACYLSAVVALAGVLMAFLLTLAPERRRPC